MHVGLINLEPKIFNTALMQLSRYHKDRGDTVEWWMAVEPGQARLFPYDVVYCSSIFDFTDTSEVPNDAICGGTGFDVTSRLSKDMEASDLDYSIYPDCKVSYIRFSRGCKRRCPFCVVPEKEGKLYPVELKNLNPQGESIVVYDNFMSLDEWASALLGLQTIGQAVDFQSIDVRDLNRMKCRALNLMRLKKRIKIAWDNPRENLVPKLKEIIQDIPARQWMCYVLIGYWSSEEEDMYRVETLRDLGIDPFVMPYNKRDLYQKSFARWVNHKAIFAKVPWNNYQKRVAVSEASGKGWSK